MTFLLVMVGYYLIGKFTFQPFNLILNAHAHEKQISEFIYAWNVSLWFCVQPWSCIPMLLGVGTVVRFVLLMWSLRLIHNISLPLSAFYCKLKTSTNLNGVFNCDNGNEWSVCFHSNFSFSRAPCPLFKGFLTLIDLWLYTCTSTLIPKWLWPWPEPPIHPHYTLLLYL